MERKLQILALVLVAGALLNLPVLALDPMGTPTAGLNQGKWRIGAEYSFSNMDIETEGIPELDLVATTVENTQINKVFANIGAGLSDDVEIFLRLGGTGINPDKDDNSDNLAGYIGNGNGFSAGGGIKASLFKSDDKKVKLGALAQMSWGEIDFEKKSYSIEGYNVSLSSDVSFIEAQFAVGPTIEIANGFSIYGGPFLRLVSGDFDLNGSVDGLSDRFSTDLKNEARFGGYVGTQLDCKPGADEITNGTVLFAEFQFSKDAWGFGAGIGIKF